MRIGAFSFEPKPLTTSAAIATIALLAWLGQWQVNRAEEKQARQALYDARQGETAVTLTGSVASAEPLLYRRVRARGQWMPDKQIFVDNQVRDGRGAGFHVITPLQLDGRAEAVLVNRGWIARNPDYPRTPTVAVPKGVVEVAGLAIRPPARYRELSSQTVAGNVWQNLSIERYAQSSGLALLPVVVLAESAGEGLLPVTEKPDAGVARHQEYALTWFALALTVLVLWLVLNTRRNR